LKSFEHIKYLLILFCVRIEAKQYSVNYASEAHEIDQQNLYSQLQKFNDRLESTDEDEDDQPITLGLLYSSVLNVITHIYKHSEDEFYNFNSIFNRCRKNSCDY